MRPPFKLLDHQSAPLESQSLLAALRDSRGMTTNLERAMASSPALLKAYTQILAAFAHTSLSEVERQVVMLAISKDNDCGYCAAWHTAMALRAGLSSADTEAMRSGMPLSDGRLESLRQFATAIAQQRGHISTEALTDFLVHGWNAQQALDVIVGIGAKTLSNYASSLMRVELDRAVSKYSLPGNAHA
jgi:AhpD family alkylhydroperoxidase